jgi:hypothetical protein
MEKTMNLKLIRLISGEEIICELTEQESSYTLTNAFVLIPGGEGKIAFMPFMPYSTGSDTGVTIKDTHVLFVTEPVEELAAQIKTQLGVVESGIIMPEQGIIT